jgi:hypothetical protein
MKLKLKCDDNGKFGFVETYKPYAYNTGSVSMMVIANAGSFIAEPYVYRGGSFIPAKTIEEEMGISKYITAKKPFYSVLGTGNIIVDMKVAYDLKTKEYIKEKSTFNLYGVVKDSLAFDGKKGWVVDIRRLTTSSPEIDAWLDDMARKVASTGKDREELLKIRFN